MKGYVAHSKRNSIFKVNVILRGQRPTQFKLLKNFLTLKELDHWKLGWKVLILIFDLGKSLSKEISCKMADT